MAVKGAHALSVCANECMCTCEGPLQMAARKGDIAALEAALAAKGERYS